jgi:hypothetical protein
MTRDHTYRYLGNFMPSDSEELISIARTRDGVHFEYWNELLQIWRELRDDSYGERQIHIHDTSLDENWARVVFPNAFLEDQDRKSP